MKTVSAHAPAVSHAPSLPLPQVCRPMPGPQDAQRKHRPSPARVASVTALSPGAVLYPAVAGDRASLAERAGPRPNGLR